MTDRTADAALQVRQLFDAKAATWPSKYTTNGRLGPTDPPGLRSDLSQGGVAARRCGRRPGEMRDTT